MLEWVTLSGVTGGERDAVGAEGFEETRTTAANGFDGAASG